MRNINPFSLSFGRGSGSHLSTAALEFAAGGPIRGDTPSLRDALPSQRIAPLSCPQGLFHRLSANQEPVHNHIQEAP